MRKYTNMENYISLKEASRYCNYSQDYLKLRARQGKFKAVKIGRNWVTTREWVGEYSDKVEGVRDRQKKSRFLGFKSVCLIAGLGLLALAFLIFVDLDKTKYFLANVASFIPSRVVEIR